MLCQGRFIYKYKYTICTGKRSCDIVYTRSVHNTQREKEHKENNVRNLFFLCIYSFFLSACFFPEGNFTQAESEDLKLIYKEDSSSHNVSLEQPTLTLILSLESYSEHDVEVLYIPLHVAYTTSRGAQGRLWYKETSVCTVASFTATVLDRGSYTSDNNEVVSACTSHPVFFEPVIHLGRLPRQDYTVPPGRNRDISIAISFDKTLLEQGGLLEVGIESPEAYVIGSRNEARPADVAVNVDINKKWIPFHITE